MDLLMQGIVLMVIGMATVFSFLMLLVVAMNGSAAYFRKFAHLFPEAVKTPAKKTSATDPVAEIAVALAAIKAKRG
ncbi:MAG: OadG family protein [Kiritimatiellales bacterium]|nr:OadG family protein [Kiritimatiellales bacterium]MCF7863164.1 OadG family protein [Kiritimatiellales bacterium]